MDDKEKAIEDLKKRLREQKARINPEILASAVAAAKNKMEKPAPEEADTVPYDKEAAGKAVELFLRSHSNAAEFRKKLLLFLKKNAGNL